MKSFKKIVSSVFTLLAFCFLFTNVITVHADEMVDGKVYVSPYRTAKGKIKSTTKKRMEVDNFNTLIVYHGAGDTIKKLKVNKKSGLASAVTVYSSADSTYRDYGYSYIELHATKPGKYKVSFSVVGADGKTVAKKAVTVQVVNSGGLIKKATFGSQTVISNTVTYKNGTYKSVNKENTKVKGSSGKLKITSNSQFKITGIIVEYLDKNGKWAYKKINNGGTAPLSQVYGSVSKTPTTYKRSSKKNTYIYVSYKDTFFGDTCKYTIVKNRGYKEVKCVYKDKEAGGTEVYYSPGATFSLWSY